MRRRVNRGNNGAANLNANNSWNTNTNNGLRLVLIIYVVKIAAITVAAARLANSSRERNSFTDVGVNTLTMALCRLPRSALMSILYEQILSDENIEYSYSRCMLGKSKYKRDAIMFDEDKSYNINRLIDSVRGKTYAPKDYNEFKVYEPKERVIHAPAFKDKLIQRMVYNVLKGQYKKIFISDSYACIDGKGTHAASKKTQQYLRKAGWEYGDKAFIVKMDISKFFYSIDRSLLKQLYRKKIKCADTLWLLDKIVDSAPGDVGLPLGNITSHTFANIIGNKIDQYCKRYLGVKYYIRYMDDIFMVLRSRDRAKEILRKCKHYVESNLLLKLNASKTKLFPLKQGVNFVGFKTYKTHKLLRDRSKRKIKSRLRCFPGMIKSGYMGIEKAEQMLNSWHGHAKNGSSVNFINSIMGRYDYICKNGNRLEISRSKL